EGKFSRGEGLTQDDINTLLLKSQYNHINHLDQKLDEVTAAVVALEGKFHGLEGKFQALEGKFQALEARFEAFKGELSAEFERRMGALETKVEARMGTLETKMEARMGALETQFAQLETKFQEAQVKMQQTVLTTMKWYIGGAGIVLVLMKALDLFIVR
ncbi:MAG: hypothetical protein N2441_08455, partial [Rhodocyclaceae bacterium]|nr:hypothetical protein [Rhodocyclaceae bacterium]